MSTMPVAPSPLTASQNVARIRRVHRIWGGGASICLPKRDTLSAKEGHARHVLLFTHTPANIS